MGRRRPLARGAARLAALAMIVTVVAARAEEPTVPSPTGFVTDTAGVIDAGTRQRIERLATELQQKTGSEIAVLTVETTAPLDDFSYAMRVAETWKPGRKQEDTGVLVLLATQDRKLRILTGYGVEGVLPDGLVGAIQDREMVPAFKAGRLAEGIENGVRAIAARIAAERGVTLTGLPAPRAAPQPGVPLWAIVLVIAIVILLVAASDGPSSGVRGRRRVVYGPGPWPGGFGGGGGGGFGGGGGGFGGFGGGGFGGGGAGRSW